MHESEVRLKLSILNEAREILRTSWCAGVVHHDDGVRHCALGALEVAVVKTAALKTDPGRDTRHNLLFGGHGVILIHELNRMSVTLHPELARTGTAMVHVNNNLGQDAIVAVFDAVILDLELRLAPALPADPVDESADEPAETADPVLA